MPTPAAHPARPAPGHLDTAARRVVYLPVNRPFEDAFRSVAAEVSALPDAARDGVTLLVVDDCPEEVSKANRRVTDEVAGASGLRTRVLDGDGWRRLADDILAASGLSAGDRDLARAALVKPTGSYGAGPNKAALVAALEGAVSLHRRDSDQITRVDRTTGASPLRVEAELLDRGRAGDDSGAHCVGSSLTGRPTRDRRDLEHGAADYAERIDALSRLTPDRPRPPRPEEPGPPERVTLHGAESAERDHTGTVEMGIAALRTVYEWIPEMPAVGILGSDYFQKGLLYQLGLPVYHHNLTARHVYEPWRAEQSSTAHLGWYARAELRYAILRRHWNAFNQALLADRRRVLRDGRFDSTAYGELFTDALRRGAGEAERIPDAYVAVYREAAGAASGELRRRLEIRIAALEDEAGSAAAYVADAVHEFAGLARVWPALIAAAGRAGRDTSLEAYT
ncbi:DUF6271 family protein [Streptomyces sp. LP05-1]|uniref:DUF6271 family protein n=1 Tax=Streptomyces pyxinae TaxID=2970734 RepID=A0ABT2CHP9_9ACTN|nr:DUF6271 family protein [Streptomyces sp. LP05-1]MCS0636941.1 DUF6271 family protein [Streptomyces sp. LP05-1]